MSFFSLISILISLAAVTNYVNYRYIKLPTTIGVMLVALVASLTLILIGPYVGGVREQAATLVSRIDFDQVVLHGMLAFLLFAAAIHVKFEDIGREWRSISLRGRDSRGDAHGAVGDHGGRRALAGDAYRGLWAVYDAARSGLGAVRLGLCAGVVPLE